MLLLSGSTVTGIFFPRELFSSERPTLHTFLSFYQSPHRISPRERHLTGPDSIIKNERNKVLEACSLQCGNTGTWSNRGGHHAVHASC